MRKLFLLCTLLLAICLVSCDLLTGSKVDMYKTVSDAVDWANAPKLSVRIEFPAKWGVSNPAQGGITPAMDIRKGYEFNVEFTPDVQYSLKTWMVFRTEDLEKLSYPTSWVDNLDLINPINIQSLGSDDVELPEVNTADKVYKFKIFTTDPVTLVPWCDTEPRITRTDPRHRPDGPPYSRAKDITLYFNGELDADTVKFANSETDDGIWITAAVGDNVTTNKNEKWYSDPEYAAKGGFFTVTMKSAKLPPEESLMTVTVRGINNSQGNPMASAGYSFSWKTSQAVNVNLSSFSAAYKYDENKIKVKYTQTGADSDGVKTYYRLNKGSNIEFSETISNVPVLNDTGTREGRQITNIAEYEIFIELYVDEIMEDRTSFKIWNFPGMSVAHNNQVTEIKTADELAAIKDNLDRQYVLANDVNITGEWKPVGTDTSPFKGKFYGNGRMVTINGLAADNDDVGLFGVVSGGLVRDLTVEYDDVEVNGAANVGGIAGQIKNGARILNCVVKGMTVVKTLTLNQSGDGNACLGGIAGMATNSFIGNCRTGLNVELIKDSGTGNVGAVAGFTNGGSDGSITINIAPPGKPADKKTVSQLAIDGVTVAADVGGNMNGGALSIGGAVGGSSGNTVRDIVVSGGKVSFNRTDIEGGTRVGGVTGYAENSNMEACSFVSFADNAIDGVIDDLKSIYLQLGGLIGCCTTNNDNVYINNCLVRGNLEINEKVYEEERYNGGVNIGGVLGLSEFKAGAEKVYITNSFFEEGDITAACSSGSIQAGGFCGAFYEEGEQTENSHYINNCGVMAGTVSVDVRYYGKYIYAGGFTSQIWLKGNTSNCFSRANVISKGRGNNDEESGSIYSYTHQAGGFTGALAPDSTLTSCYATGFVQSEHNGNRDLSVGGLVGNSGGIINNCYALGNVLADKTGGTSNANAGGLVGSTYSGEVKFSFSAGRIIAQSKESMTNANAGGIVGNLYDTSLNNTAALGKSVTALGGGDMYAGRIIGSTYLSNISKNYALNTMEIEEDEYNATAPAKQDANEGVVAEFDTTSDGQDTNSGVFFTQPFWNGSETLNFPSDIWDFNRVGRDGYPRLANVGGQ